MRKCDIASSQRAFRWQVDNLTRRQFLLVSGSLVATALLSGKRTTRAARSQVVVACANRLGEAAPIADFLGAGGGLYYMSKKADDPVVKAWRDAGMRHLTFETLHTEDPLDRWITVKREKNAIQVDFTDYDGYLKSYREYLQVQPFVYLGGMPRALSSLPNDPHYEVRMPRDLNEWTAFVIQIVTHNVALGLRGLFYGAPGEPDYAGADYGTWLYRADAPASTQLPNSIALYAATYRGVKAADPTAKVGGPATMNWQETKWTRRPPFVLADWIRALAQFNRQAGENAVKLDYISWQDYAWSSQRLSDGADAVSKFLSNNGFDPHTPKVLGGSGWGSWSSDYLDNSWQPHQRASHAAYNIIREFKDPQQRKFALALYFPFYYKDEWRSPDEYITEVALVRITEQGNLRLTPIYAVFQMANAMRHGEIVQTTAPAPLEAMAVRWDDAQGVLIMINNHTAKAATFEVVIRDAPLPNGAAVRSIQRIDANNSIDGDGLQNARWDSVTVSAGATMFPLTLDPYATLHIALYPSQK